MLFVYIYTHIYIFTYVYIYIYIYIYIIILAQEPAQQSENRGGNPTAARVTRGENRGGKGNHGSEHHWRQDQGPSAEGCQRHL